MEEENEEEDEVQIGGDNEEQIGGEKDEEEVEGEDGVQIGGEDEVGQPDDDFFMRALKYDELISNGLYVFHVFQRCSLVLVGLETKIENGSLSDNMIESLRHCVSVLKIYVAFHKSAAEEAFAILNDLFPNGWSF